MVLSVRVVESEGMLICRYIVSESEVKLVFFASAPCNRCYCVMRLTVSECENISLLVGIALPCLKDLVRELYESRLVEGDSKVLTDAVTEAGYEVVSVS